MLAPAAPRPSSSYGQSYLASMRLVGGRDGTVGRLEVLPRSALDIGWGTVCASNFGEAHAQVGRGRGCRGRVREAPCAPQLVRQGAARVSSSLEVLSLGVGPARSTASALKQLHKPPQQHKFVRQQLVHLQLQSPRMMLPAVVRHIALPPSGFPGCRSTRRLCVATWVSPGRRRRWWPPTRCRKQTRSSPSTLTMCSVQVVGWGCRAGGPRQGLMGACGAACVRGWAPCVCGTLGFLSGVVSAPHLPYLPCRGMVPLVHGAWSSGSVVFLPGPCSQAAADVMYSATAMAVALLLRAGYDAAGGASTTTDAPLSFLRDCTRGWNGGFLPSCGHHADVVIACGGEGERRMDRTHGWWGVGRRL